MAFSLNNSPAVTSGSGPGFTEYSYIVYNNSGTFQVYDKTGALVHSSSNAADEINWAIGQLPAVGGTIFLKAGDYPITTGKSITIDRDDVSLNGEGLRTTLSAGANSVNVVTLGNASYTTRNRILLRNIYIRDSSAGAHTGITGLLVYKILYSIFENIVVDSMSTAWIFKQGAGGNVQRAAECQLVNIRIINFYTYGLYIESLEDTEIVNMNVGTGNSGATSCIHIQCPNSGEDAGGSGVFFSNLHFWGVAGDTTNGIRFGAENNGVFNIKFCNVIGGDVKTGLLFTGANAHDISMSNVLIGTCSVARLTDSGAYNCVVNYRPGLSAVTPGYWLSASGFHAYA